MYRFLSCLISDGFLVLFTQVIKYKFRPPALMQKLDMLAHVCIFRTGMWSLGDPSASLAKHFSSATQQPHVLSENQRHYLKKDQLGSVIEEIYTKIYILSAHDAWVKCVNLPYFICLCMYLCKYVSVTHMNEHTQSLYICQKCMNII